MYKNFGDVNFFANGMLIEQDSESTYNVIYCEPIPDDFTSGDEQKWLFSRCYVDIADSRLNKDAVARCNGYSGTLEETKNAYDFCPEWYVCDLFNYYGWDAFTTDYYAKHELTADEVMNEIRNIETDCNVIFDTDI